MRSLCILLSTAIAIIGLIFIIWGCIHPAKYQKELSKESTTAVRVTQVYMEATYYVTVGIAIVSLGLLVSLIGILITTNTETDVYSRFVNFISNYRIKKEEKSLSDHEEQGG